MSDDSSEIISNPRAAPSGWIVGLLALLATVMLFFGTQFVALVVVELYGTLQHLAAGSLEGWLMNSFEAQFLYSVLAEGLLILGVALLIRLFRWTWANIGMLRPKAKHLVIGLLAVVPYYLIFLVIVVAVGALVPSLNISQKQEIGFSGVQGALPLALTFISLVIMPALAEEITMRGFLYTGLKKWLPTVAAGLLVSVLFGAAHLSEGGEAGPLWIGAIDTFTLSLVLVFLREKTGNLWAGIVLHAAKNSIAFATLFLIGSR